MHSFYKIVLAVFLVSFITTGLYASDTHAQATPTPQATPQVTPEIRPFPMSVATNIEVIDQAIQSGDIVEMSDKGIVRSKTPYGKKMIGVIAGNPVIVIHEKTNTNRSLATSGEAHVRVTAKNGAINVGDFVTGSDVPGLGMKAREAGYVLGIAKTAFAPPNSNTVGTSTATGTVIVALNIQFAATAPSELGNPIIRLVYAFTTAFEDQSKISQTIRYVIGSFVALLIFLAAILLFGRSIGKSIEAIGRNPLARNSIQFQMIVNLILSIIVTIAGIAVAFIIIRI